MRRLVLERRDVLVGWVVVPDVEEGGCGWEAFAVRCSDIGCVDTGAEDAGAGTGCFYEDCLEESSSTKACETPEGYVEDDTDCDDDDASIYPGADEIWDDGIDQDCDGEEACSNAEACREAEPCPYAHPTHVPDAELATLAIRSTISGSARYVHRDHTPAIRDTRFTNLYT